jgi:hypothetical protein
MLGLAKIGYLPSLSLIHSFITISKSTTEKEEYNYNTIQSNPTCAG